MSIETNAGMSPEWLVQNFEKMAREQKPIDYIIVGNSGAISIMQALCSGKIRGYSTPQGDFKVEGITIKLQHQDPDVNLAVAVPVSLDFRYWPPKIDSMESA